MPNLKFVLWNMEWLNDLFVKGSGPAQFRPDDEKSQNSEGTIKQRRDDLSGVLRELNPDVVIVVEGPSLPEELQIFFDSIGQGTWATGLQVSPGQSQNIGVAIRTDTGSSSNHRCNVGIPEPILALTHFLSIPIVMISKNSITLKDGRSTQRSILQKERLSECLVFI